MTDLTADSFSAAPICQCPDCKCTATLDAEALELPRAERLCDDCEAGRHFEELAR